MASSNLDALIKFGKNTNRIGEIVYVLFKYGLADWLGELKFTFIQERLRTLDGRSVSDMPFQARFRNALSELGPTFIKLGQLLSTRPEMVGAGLAAELAKLQTAAPPDDPETVRALLVSEWGDDPDVLLASFDPVPLASASIGQAHAAVLKSGRDVVVKIQHAGIEKKINADLEILDGLADLAEKHSKDLAAYRPAQVLRQFRRMVLRELDFSYERRSLEQFGENFAEDAEIRFPKVIRELSTRRVLVMERVKGVCGADAPGLAASGVDLADFARKCAEAFMKMIFRDGFYHADPHPGNFVLSPDGTVGIIDCGQVGRLDETLRATVDAMLYAIVEKDASSFSDLLLRGGVVPADCSKQQLRADLDDFFADLSEASLQDFDIGGALKDLIELIRKHRILLPPNLSLLLKTLILLEGASKGFSTNFSLIEILKPYYIRSIKTGFSPKRVLGRARKSLHDWERLVAALPRDLADILTGLKSGSFEVMLKHERLDAAINRLVLGLIIAALLIGSSELLAREAPPRIFGYSIPAFIGYGFVVMLGRRLYTLIRRSETEREGG